MQRKSEVNIPSGFYAYMWLREDGTPYYVGKGGGRRAWDSYSHGVNPPNDKSRILIFERVSEVEAFETEKELIFNWGRKDLGTGCLRNLTDGGEGFSGRSEEVRKAISQKQLGNQNAFGHKLTGDSLKKVQTSAKLGGQVIVDKKLGIFSPDFDKSKRMEAIKAFHASLTSEKRHFRAVKANEALTVEQHRENGKLGYIKSGSGRSLHIRWHVNRGLVNPDCRFCVVY